MSDVFATHNLPWGAGKDIPKLIDSYGSQVAGVTIEDYETRKAIVDRLNSYSDLYEALQEAESRLRQIWGDDDTVLTEVRAALLKCEEGR